MKLPKNYFILFFCFFCKLCDFSLFLCLHQPFYILCKLFQVSGFSLICFKVIKLLFLIRGDLKAFYRPLAHGFLCHLAIETFQRPSTFVGTFPNVINFRANSGCLLRIRYFSQIR